MKTAVLIGLGMVARTHLAALADARGVTLGGVMGRNKIKATGFAKEASAQLGQTVKVYSDVSEIARDKTVDFAIIATPPDARFELVTALAKARKPMLMEKPLERNLTAAIQLVDTCEGAGVLLGVVMQHRMRDETVALKQAVANGDLGKIVSAEIRIPWWRDQSYYDAPGRGTYERDGGGVMITQAIHTLDLALWVLGSFKRVQALMQTTDLHRMEAEDWAGALFETETGCVGTLSATTAAFPGRSEGMNLYGSKGSAQLQAGKLVMVYHSGHTDTYGKDTATGSGADPMAFSHLWHQRVIEDFVQCLDTERLPRASGRSALSSLAVIDAMQKSNDSGQWARVRKR